MKDGIRILGIDDAPFEHSDESTLLTGVVYRGTEFIEDIRSLEIDVDGESATDRVIELYRSCNNPAQIRALILDGISFAGFNVVDLERISSETERPVVASTPNRPDREDFRQAMEESGNEDENFEKLPDYTGIELEDGEVYIQFEGCSTDEAARLVRKSVIHGQVPEPVRVADMIGYSLVDRG